MSDQPILYAYKGKPPRELTDDDRERGIVAQQPAHHPGVPLRDLTADDLESMPTWLLDTVAASDLYEATPTGTRRRNVIKREKAVENEGVPEAPPVAETSKPAPKAEKEG